MREFTDKDVAKAFIGHKGDQIYRISATREDLIDSPMWYHLKGLMQTATGYGPKLNSGYKIKLNNRLYRVYTTIWSNSGINWIIANGQKIIIS